MRFTSRRLTPEMTGPARKESGMIATGYFWFYAGVGAFVPYAALYYQDLGFSGLKLGILTALPALGSSLTGPFWGILADTWSAHREILRVVLAVATIVTLALAQVVTYVPFLILLAILAFALVPVPSLWDSYAISAVERGGAPYGTLRIAGSLGFTCVVLIMGLVMDDGMTSAFIYVYAFCHAMACLAAFFLPKKAERQPRRLMDGIDAVRRQPNYLLLLLVAFLMSTGYAMLSMYLGLHVRSLGGGTEIVGTAFATSAISELPIIGFGTWILMRVGGRRMVIVSLLAYAVRFALLGFTHTPEFVIAAQALHGLSFGMFLVASVTLAHRLVGSEHSATAQALLGTMSFGFGSITGSLVGSILIDRVGTSAMYQGVSVVMLLTLATYVWADRSLRSRPMGQLAP